jgi:hypothetical protein
MTEDVIRFEIAKLELQSGDTLVVRTELVLSLEQVTIIGPYVPEGTKIMVLQAYIRSNGMSLEVLREQPSP